ncbi:amidohydrolase family protein [Streptomyces hainanensis]|uniref:Amidohydrolase n=1 Tax=Streptomyces hainanensis TaxID=402648 RepID=A0A4R4TKY7_9ACTN|nr:amidohydrolase family protein [Streptomyces hainanensis]TDC78537.1 amidohydrolase [Streptomyces hainanensis]
MGRIDAHHHVWDLARRPHDWLAGPETAAIRRSFGLADLAGPAADAGVARTVLVQVLPETAETAEFLALAADDELVAGVVGWVDLTLGDAVAERLAALRDGPGGELLVGVRHLVQGEPDDRWLCRPDVRRGLAAVAAAGLAYDLLVLPHQLPAALDTVRALPGLTFVLDHLAKPPIAAGSRQPWAGLLGELAAEPNVYAKLSGLVTEADHAAWTVAALRPYAETALTAFGAGRLMFGSDWPVCLLAASYAEVVGAAEELTAALGPAERADVFGDVAARVYRLPARPAG